MGFYLNPGNIGFARISGSNYVDKTGLISLINTRIRDNESLVCISRPRRFGKTYAAKMLAAYYDCSCDSHELFDHRIISRAKDYPAFLNQFNVICFDVTTFITLAQRRNLPVRDIPNLICDEIHKELSGMDPAWDSQESVETSLMRCVTAPGGKPFIFIIDEWDALIREAKNDKETQKRYFNLLRGWFKSISFTPKVVAAAYMTGILPIKKDGSQSAISDFREFSMLEPGLFAEFYGFTEDEVRKICEDNGLGFEEAKLWYDGYKVGALQAMYNPYSVMEAVDKHKFKSYWKRTSVAEALMYYIDMDLEGLQSDIVSLISGQSIEVDTDSFRNDFETFTCKDDVLTLLIHLGYLTYEEEEAAGIASIPNEEVRMEFDKILRRAKHQGLIELVRKSDQLLKDTLDGNSDAVAKGIQEVHETAFAPTLYNNEQALRYTVKMAYISCVDQYAKVEELPSGHGLSDTVFLPKRRSSLPAMVIELKWDISAEGAIKQIRDKNYAGLPVMLGEEVLLVGIDYSRKTKQHTCVMERISNFP